MHAHAEASRGEERGAGGEQAWCEAWRADGRAWGVAGGYPAGGYPAGLAVSGDEELMAVSVHVRGAGPHGRGLGCLLWLIGSSRLKL